MQQTFLGKEPELPRRVLDRDMATRAALRTVNARIWRVYNRSWFIGSVIVAFDQMGTLSSKCGSFQPPVFQFADIALELEQVESFRRIRGRFKVKRDIITLMVVIRRNGWRSPLRRKFSVVLICR